ncbi:MAG: hypothetical protein WA634_17055 [Silvibacterium sp.]
MSGRRGCLASLGGCLFKLILFSVAACAFMWLVLVAIGPWALHIGGRSTPLLFWHGSGTVLNKDGKTYPLYVSFWPGKPSGFSGGGRREGKGVRATITGTGWLCVAPGSIERMDISGTMYGGYSSTADSLFDFRLLEWQRPFAFNHYNRGFFDLAGAFHGPDLVMDRTNEQGIKFLSGLFIDHATATFHWADYSTFESNCRNLGSAAK